MIYIQVWHIIRRELIPVGFDYNLVTSLYIGR